MNDCVFNWIKCYWITNANSGFLIFLYWNPCGSQKHKRPLYWPTTTGNKIAIEGSIIANFCNILFRSGSSFVGDIFSHHPDVFYLFEPLKLFRHLKKDYTEARREWLLTQGEKYVFLGVSQYLLGVGGIIINKSICSPPGILEKIIFNVFENFLHGYGLWGFAARLNKNCHIQTSNGTIREGLLEMRKWSKKAYILVKKETFFIIFYDNYHTCMSDILQRNSWKGQLQFFVLGSGHYLRQGAGQCKSENRVH